VGNSNRPPVMEIAWSLALIKRPSSDRIAAAMDSPSWTRAARREGWGCGKWVIRWLNYRMPLESVIHYGSRCADSRVHHGFPAANWRRRKHLRRGYQIINVPKDESTFSVLPGHRLSLRGGASAAKGFRQSREQVGGNERGFTQAFAHDVAG